MMAAGMSQDWKEFVDQGVSALLFALGIAGGILCAAAVVSLLKQTPVYRGDRGDSDRNRNKKRRRRPFLLMEEQPSPFSFPEQPML